MKVSFFLLKFPLSSETFVLNQITAFIDMGHEVEIVALQKGDTQHTHAAWEKYGLAAKTRWLQDEPQVVSFALLGEVCNKSICTQCTGS